MTKNITVRRALISVSDKAGVVDFAKRLSAQRITLISTGGTAKALLDAGLPVTPIDEVTGFPEMLDGRVKTLHPNVHGGILARRDLPAHVAALKEHGIQGIELVCVNLYPFEETVAKGEPFEACVEQIDIGGPSMVRSAAKNHNDVVIVTDPGDYDAVARAIEGDGVPAALSRSLAGKAFARTAAYDRAIADSLAWDGTPEADSNELPKTLNLRYERVRTLRYGENPHQHAAVYRDPNATGVSLPRAEQLHGKELSYNNLNDASAALALAMDLSDAHPGSAAAVVVKHTNPCGCAVAKTIGDAVKGAYAGDPLAAFGGILAVNKTIDADAAAFLAEGQKFFEVIIAPGYTADALKTLGDRWANVRLLRAPEIARVKRADDTALVAKPILGGAIVQSPDLALAVTEDWAHAAGPSPDATAIDAARLVWIACKHLASNAIAIGGTDPATNTVRLFGAGTGQMDRVASSRNAVEKAGASAKGAIAASDAFFPFTDAPQILIDAGVAGIVHPGGSKRDDETFQLCNDKAVWCMTTGVRHFRH